MHWSPYRTVTMYMHACFIVNVTNCKQIQGFTTLGNKYYVQNDYRTYCNFYRSNRLLCRKRDIIVLCSFTLLTDIDAWNRFLTGDFAKGWQTRINNWVLDGDVRPVLVVRYEDLKKDTATEVAKMLDFLNIEYTSRQDIHQRICQGYTEFKRLHTAKDDFEHFTQKQRDFIGSLINDVLISAKAVNKSHILKLEEYIM